jgi:membrane protease YdiL (CAAX protease family)
MTASTGVAWRRVALYYGIALGGSTIAALVAFAARQGLGSAGAVVALVVTAVFYMPMPLVAGLVTERVTGRRPLLAGEWRALRTSFWRTYGRNALAAVAAIAAVLVVAFGVAWLAGALAVPGAGHLAAPDGLPLPPAVLIPVVIAEGVLAGLTINGLFAFGEEYGWRGVLAEELRPLGAVRANLVTGVLWGLWHAPIIILLGHNYGSEWGWGILVMVAWVTPFSFLLWRVRERTGSVLAPAMLHGAANGSLGVFTVIVSGGSVLVALPVGLLLALTMAIVAIVGWRLPALDPPGDQGA